MEKRGSRKIPERLEMPALQKWLIIAGLGVLGGLYGLDPAVAASLPAPDAANQVGDLGAFLVVESIYVGLGIWLGSTFVDKPDGGGGNNSPLRPA